MAPAASALRQITRDGSRSFSRRSTESFSSEAFARELPVATVSSERRRDANAHDDLGVNRGIDVPRRFGPPGTCARAARLSISWRRTSMAGPIVLRDDRARGRGACRAPARSNSHDRPAMRLPSSAGSFAVPSIPLRDASVHWRHMNRHRLPVYFISHGGGPWSYMDDPSRAHYAKLEAALAAMPRQIGTTPAAVLMISAHWEEPEFTLTSHPKPPMIYDYGGFPGLHLSHPLRRARRSGAGGARRGR